MHKPPEHLMACPPRCPPSQRGWRQEHWWRGRLWGAPGRPDVVGAFLRIGSQMWESSYPPSSWFIGISVLSLRTCIASFIRLRIQMLSRSSMLTSSKFIRWFCSLACTEMADLKVEVSSETDVLRVFLVAVTFSVSLRCSSMRTLIFLPVSPM